MTDQPTTPAAPEAQPQPQPAAVYVTAPAPHVARPGGVTLLMALGMLHGIVSLAAGLFLIIDSDSTTLQQTAQLTSDQLAVTGIVMTIFGGILFLLALALGRGSQVVRWLFGLTTLVNVSFSVWGAFSLHSEQRMTSVFSLVFGLMILWILFGSERTDRFFAQD